jgi:hypothetical protein
MADIFEMRKKLESLSKKDYHKYLILNDKYVPPFECFSEKFLALIKSESKTIPEPDEMKIAKN